LVDVPVLSELLQEYVCFEGFELRTPQECFLFIFAGIVEV
jgi:hypothetical protein